MLFGLPFWAIRLIIDVLKAIGAINFAQTLAVKLYLKIEQLKTYEEYPGDPKPPASSSNINRGDQ